MSVLLFFISMMFFAEAFLLGGKNNKITEGGKPYIIGMGILFLIGAIFFGSTAYADHITKEGIFKNDPTYHSDKKIILSCRYGEAEKYNVVLDINGDNATVYHINKNEVYYFNDLELEDPNIEYKSGQDWSILWIGGYIAIEFNTLRINYGYASKEEVFEGDNLYGPCVEINEIKPEDIKKRY